MSAHTPGPWTLHPEFGSPVVGIDCEDGGDLLPIAHTVGGMDKEECKANARLIASAPDLLDALRSLLARSLALDQSPTHDGLLNCEVIAQARAAIRKATGESA